MAPCGTTPDPNIIHLIRVHVFLWFCAWLRHVLSFTQSFDELPSKNGPIPETLTRLAVEKIVDGKAAERPARLALLRLLASEKKLPEEALQTALGPIIEAIEDVAIDAPNAERRVLYKYMMVMKCLSPRCRVWRECGGRRFDRDAGVMWRVLQCGTGRAG